MPTPVVIKSGTPDGSAGSPLPAYQVDLGAGVADVVAGALVDPTTGLPIGAGAGGQALPVQVPALPLPTGASTEATLAAIKTKTDNLDVLLSTRTKPADTQAVSAASLPLPAGASTEATLALIKAKTDNLDVALSSRTKPGDVQGIGGTVAVSNFPATQPVSAAALPLPTGAAADGTVATLAKDATLGVVGPTPGAYTVLDRLAQVGSKLDVHTALLRQLVAAQPPPRPKATTTLLHRS